MMLSSNSSSCNQNPNYTPFSENDITSFTSKSENPNFLFPFPNSPFQDYQDVYLHFLDHVYLNAPPDCEAAVGTYIPAAAPDESVIEKPITNPAVAPPKKDRHSKIHTARGPRDRRMRLSLDIARRFFNLQDLLGYDKASRTVDWLLRSSGPAIRALTQGQAELLDGLGVSESCTDEDCGEVEAAASSSAATAAGSKSRRGKRGRRGGVQQKRATVARESRRKARERARERTSQKRRLMRERESESGGAPMYGTAARVAEDLSSDEARIYAATAQWDSCLHETHTALFHQDEQIEEFEFNGKPWEAYNSFDMSV